jgi:tRNA G18 (ribose-2'-O)-methylase SpoU
MIYVVLDNIRSCYNVGAIFRTADAVGVTKIYLTGYTPTPIDRFGRVVPEIAKTALGASARVPWEQVSEIDVVISKLAKEGVMVAAVEQTPAAVSLYETKCSGAVALIFGNEVSGVSPAALEASQCHIELPMYGTKESLNVSVTAGIVLYEVRHHHLV